jgi:dCTP deaminase
MGVIALATDGDVPSVVTDRQRFALDGRAVLIVDAESEQLDPASNECNISYDLRVGDHYRDHRYEESMTIDRDDHAIEIFPGMAVIIQTLEEVEFPKWLFGHVVPKVSLLQKGLANTPTKIDPGYRGRLLITTFNHGKRPLYLRRGQRFCAMFVSTVEGAIKPYNKPGKQLRGTAASKGRFQKVIDRLEARPVIVGGAISLTAVVIAVVSLLV